MTIENTTLVNSEVSEIKAPETKDTIMSFAPLVLIFVVFYFFVIRPQVKKQKAQETLVKSAKKGDKVIIAGGLIGKIIKEKDANVIVELAKDVHVEALRNAIVSVINDNSINTETNAKKK
jgi:preprotein translocase subunit YajC